MIETLPFGPTGHDSTRVIFGAAALGAMSQTRADRTLELVRDYGVNHIDTAASYGDSELRLAPFLRDHRDAVFLASKTGERGGDGARAELERSLERLGVEHLDLIQLHNLADEAGWQTAMAEDGALAALIQARAEGLVRFIGVTGHGTGIAAMHSRSLERYDFASVLFPYNPSQLTDPRYAADVAALRATCRARGVAMQTIKAIARRRWREDDPERRLSWYMPLRDEAAIRRAVHFVLAEADLFLNSTSDATLLPAVLDAAAEAATAPDPAALAADQRELGIEPLFVRGVADDV